MAQITVHGKGFILRTEERADDIHAAFDAALDKMQRQVERYKGKHYRGRGDGRSAGEVLAEEEELPVDETGELLPLGVTPDERIIAAARSAMAGFVGFGGTVAVPIEAHLVTATPVSTTTPVSRTTPDSRTTPVSGTRPGG